MINWTLKTFKVKDLKEWDKNPRKLTRTQAAHLEESIRKFGLIDKPVVTQEGMIIGGHARKKILERLDIKEVSCYVPDKVLDEREICELNIRLNKNSGDFDFDKLANEFDAIDLVHWGFDIEELGIFYEEETEGETPPESCKECGRKLPSPKGRNKGRPSTKGD
jgi:ParB-like chromosome segregation protein Spo0J